MTDDRVSGQQQKPFGALKRAPRRRIARSGSHGWAGIFRAAGAAAIGAGLLWTISPALAEKGGPCHSIKQQVSAIKVTLYKSRTLCFSGPFSTAVIGAPEIADVLPITESMLYVQGKKVGATNISVFDQQRRLVSVIDLEVAPDTSSSAKQDRGQHRRQGHQCHQRERRGHSERRGDRRRRGRSRGRSRERPLAGRAGHRRDEGGALAASDAEGAHSRS